MRQRDVRVVIFGAGVAALGVAMSELLARLTRSADAGPDARLAGREGAERHLDAEAQPRRG
nr:hypothetical protein GCM10020063_025540 [Dactylosporangium thailandense]